MPELIIRAGTQDAALMRRTFGLDGGPAAPWLPSRVVVDAHVPLATADVARTTRRGGVPFLVDPQTHYLQDEQHSAFAWAKVPYGISRRVAPAEMSSPAAVERLVAECVDHQLGAGATMIIPPYVHLERTDSAWIDVQARLWRATREHLQRERISLDVLALVAVGWRMLHPIQGRAALAPASHALHDLRPAEVAVAASRAHLGVHADERLHDLLMFIEWLSERWPVIMWQQGLLGEACVVAGAIGYETGIGWREQCDLLSSMASHRRPPGPSAHPGARPVYIDALKRSVPKRSLEHIRHHRAVWSRLLCIDRRCCPPAGDGMLRDARQHSINARARSLSTLSRAQTSQWQWAQLGDDTRYGLELAARMNSLAGSQQQIQKIDDTALRAVHAIAEQRRFRRRLRATA